MQEWRNSQTRRLQVPVTARPCGFKSHLLHFLLSEGSMNKIKKAEAVLGRPLPGELIGGEIVFGIVFP